jgi:hypothetical protein
MDTQTKAHIVQAATREATRKWSGRPIPRPDPSPFRTIGLGARPDSHRIRAAGIGLGQVRDNREGLGDLVSSILSCKACPTYNMPIIEQVRWTLGGPLLDSTIQQSFGAEIDLFGSGKAVPGIAFVETTMAQPGQLQVPTLCCAIAWHLEPEPFEFTAQVNAWTRPVTGTQAPPSPDVFTLNDVNNGALGAALAPTGNTPASQIMVPGVLQWGWWAAYAFWHMARGYDLRWKIGQHTNIMDEVLRHTAYMPPNAQNGSTAGLNVDVTDFVRQTNNYYDQLGTALIALKTDFLRLGSVNLAGANIGAFRPSRALQFVPTTVGGINLRELLGANSEFRKLTVPYLIQPGIPIGLICQEADTVEADQMRRWLSITQSQQSGIPPIEVDDANILATTTVNGGNTSREVVIGAATPPTAADFVNQQVDTGTAIFKGGEGKITLAIKGFEVDGDWASVLNANPDIRDAVMRECGCGYGAR